MTAVPAVSVIIPARDAALTLEATLDSLGAQTLGGWEAVLVDDGSSDATRAIAERRSAEDPRIRVIRHIAAEGVCAARNHAIAESRAGLLHFLDADDLLAPEALELLSGALDDRRADAAHAGWMRMAEDGVTGAPAYAPGLTDLFPRAARSCPFPIHACMVRRAAVERAGGFDPSFVICEDWDLWQRIARIGARFVQVREPLALYRLRAGSGSLAPLEYLAHAQRVIATGHGRDPRVAAPDPRRAAGEPPWNQAPATLVIAAWVAGVAIARGEPVADILSALPDDRPYAVSADDVADVLFTGVTNGLGLDERSWSSLVDSHLPAVADAAELLELRAGSPDLRRRVMRRLEQLLAERGGVRGPVVAGGTWIAPWDLGRPPPARADARCERIALVAELGGERVGSVHLPLIAAELDPRVLADALPDALVWEVLGRHFERTLLPRLTLEERADGMSVRRGDVVLADGLAAEDLEPRRLHDLVGWTLLLQEVWGRSDWSVDRFYAAAAIGSVEPDAAARAVLVVDLADDLPAQLPCSRGDVAVEVRVGGVGLAVVPVRARASGGLTDGTVISAITTATGFELCRVVVREALLVREPSEHDALRDRLRGPDRPAAEPATDAAGRAPGWDAAVRRAARPGSPTLVLGLRNGGFGSAVWRRASLPTAALDALRSTAETRGEPWEVTPPGASPVAGVYAPDALTWDPIRSAHPAPERDGPAAPPDDGQVGSNPSPLGGTTQSLRGDFEQLFASGADPWRYESAYERRKYEHTMQVIGTGPIGRAMEVGCAEGHFTLALGRRAASLVAADISTIALRRARARCEAAGLDAVEYARLDLQTDPLPGGFDLIVASEVLYYLPDYEALTVAIAKLATALRPGGRLVCAHANLLVDDPDRTGFDWETPFGGRVIGDALAKDAQLEVDLELHTSLYRVQSARRGSRRSWTPARRGPRVIEADAAPPEPAVAARLRIGGGDVERSAATVTRTADSVPILMYHRVARTGPAELARWRLDPSALDEQLAYLRGTGHVSLDLACWAEHLSARTEPPERSVVLTFDDAYADVAEHVVPMLRRHGLTATVFVPTDHVGATNGWEHQARAAAPIMDWDALADVVAAGLTVASHAASHRPLTALAHHEVVLEVLRSRAAIEDRLGRPVTAIAYPYGEHDPIVRHLVGAAGIPTGVTCEARRSHAGDERLALPRIEIEGSDGLEELVRKLG